MAMQLSSQQSQAADAVQEWLSRVAPGMAGVFRLFGYAGSGKTTIARELSRDAGAVRFASFTGKAASVLREKGCHGATTIHKLIYLPQDKSGRRLRQLKTELARENEKTPPSATRVGKLERSIKMEQQNLKRPAFALNPDSELQEADLLVVDEVSMVGQKMAEDLLSFGVPILVLGDPAQLPPVGDQGYFIDAEPDFMLTEIHRQAEGNPIIGLATQIRMGGGIPFADCNSAVRVIKKGILSIEDVAAFDQVIVGKNATRHGINAQVREFQGREPHVPEVGDRLICLKNNHELSLLNGSQWEVLGIRKNDWGRYELDLEDADGGRKLLDVDCFPHYFERRGDEIPHYDMREADHFDFGYAITCHKAQGSEYDNVLVIDESYVFRGDAQKWQYTAVTRASKRLTVVRR